MGNVYRRQGVTLSIYAQVMFRGDGEREAVRDLVGRTAGGEVERAAVPVPRQ